MEKHLEAIDRYLRDFDSLNPHSLASQLDADEAFWEVSLRAIFPPFVDFGSEIVDLKQPYKRGDRDEASLDPLALLDELGNMDKLLDLPPGIRTIQTGSASHGDVIAWVPSPLDPEVDFHPRVTAKVFLPVTRQGGHVFMENLGLIHKHVRETVLPDYAQFFPPLPASLEN